MWSKGEYKCSVFGRHIAHQGSELIIHIRYSSKTGGHLADLPANVEAAVPRPAGSRPTNASEVPSAKINDQMFQIAQPHYLPLHPSHIFCQGFSRLQVFDSSLKTNLRHSPRDIYFVFPNNYGFSKLYRKSNFTPGN